MYLKNKHYSQILIKLKFFNSSSFFLTMCFLEINSHKLLKTDFEESSQSLKIEMQKSLKYLFDQKQFLFQIMLCLVLALSTVSNGQIRPILAGLLNSTQLAALNNATGGLPDVNTSILDGNLINVSVENVNVDASHALD